MEKEESKNSIREKSALVKLAWGELVRVALLRRMVKRREQRKVKENALTKARLGLACAYRVFSRRLVGFSINSVYQECK
jgi:hypothetical protein